MEWLRLICCLNLDWIEWCQYLIVDWSPAIVFDPFVPTFVLITFRFVKFDIYCLLFLVLFYLVVVSGCKCSNVNYCARHKDFIINQRRKVQPTKPEPNMAFRRWIKKASFATIDALQKFIWVSLLSKIDEIFIISVNSDVGVWSPRSLYFLSCHLILSFELNLLLSLEESTPCPLYLNGGNMIHCKSMIFEESSCQGHLIRCLNQSSTKVSQTLIFILLHNVKWRSEELLSQLLRCCKMRSKLTLSINVVVLWYSCLLHPLLLLILVNSKLLLLHLIDLS